MYRITLALLLVFGSVPSSVASAQDGDALSAREPRFFLASADRRARVRVSAAQTPVLARRIAVSLVDVTLDEALRAIAKRGSFELAYSSAMIPSGRRVRLKADEITVAGALSEVLRDLGVDVLLLRNGKAMLMRQDEAPRVGSLTGRVVDAKTDRAVIDAEVSVEGTAWRTSTDTAGRYLLSDLDAGSYTLTVRRLGYGKQSRPVTVASERQDTLDIALTPVVTKLDELVATATGSQRRRDLGNAITTINADSVLRSAPIRNLTDLLENRVPGLSVQHTSGAPGDPARLRFRGLGSVTRNNDPIVVVDGIRMYATQSEARSGNLANSSAPAPSPLDQIDPNIIDKVEVFKGPSAATLYGADAANGVIVITTKKGRPGRTRWNANVVHGRTTPAGQYPTAYFRWSRSRFENAPRFCALIDPTCLQDSLVQYQALNDPDMTVFGRGHRTEASLRASGGSQALTYSVTGTYGNEVGLLAMPVFEVERFQKQFNRGTPRWMRRPHEFKSWSVTSNVQAALGTTADVALSTTLSRTDQQRSSLESQLARLAGMYVDKVNGFYYQRDGNTAEGRYASIVSATVLQDYYTKTTASAIRFATGLNADWRPRSWLTLHADAGLDVIPRDDQQLLPTGLLSATDSGALTRATGQSLVSTFNVRGLGRMPLGKGFHFETTAGINLNTEKLGDLSTAATGLIPGTSSISGASRITSTEYRSNRSVFGWYVEPRLRGDRLSFSTGIRLDGGSNYGTRLSGLMGLPKLNGSWTISEEPFFPFKTLFSSLRLRGAYGQAQVQPGAADRLRLYNQTVALTSLGNTKLRPERSTEFEGGIDADLLDSRVTIELTAYRKTQVDALMPVTLPTSVNGGGVVLTNIGTIRNSGVEVTGRVVAVQVPAVTWGVEVGYSRNDNVLTTLGQGVVASKSNGWVEGYPVGGRWARPIVGFADQNADGILAPGEIQIADTLAFMGRIQPPHQAWLRSDLALWGGTIGVSAAFSYETGATQLDQRMRNWALMRAFSDPSASLKDQAAAVASLGSGGTDYGFIQDISTFRFSSLSVNYRAPARIARLLRTDQLSVAVQGSNLGLHSTYAGMDPDVSAWSPGENIIDAGQLPLPRTWQLRVDLQY